MCEHVEVIETRVGPRGKWGRVRPLYTVQNKKSDVENGTQRNS